MSSQMSIWNSYINSFIDFMILVSYFPWSVPYISGLYCNHFNNQPGVCNILFVRTYYMKIAAFVELTIFQFNWKMFRIGLLLIKYIYVWGDPIVVPWFYSECFNATCTRQRAHELFIRMFLLPALFYDTCSWRNYLHSLSCTLSEITK